MDNEQMRFIAIHLFSKKLFFYNQAQHVVAVDENIDYGYNRTDIF
jgi:hypothetical protein